LTLPPVWASAAGAGRAEPDKAAPSNIGTSMTFADLGLSDELLRAVTEAGYDEPTPIQHQAIRRY
jgi:superfamily II DNA/RNA helicase